MKSIHIISQLAMTEDGLKANKGRYQPVFFQQGDLDGACAVYSALMSLILIGAVRYSDIKVGNKKGDGRTRIGKLKKELFDSNGMHREGNYLFHHRYESLEEKILNAIGKEVTSQKGSGESQERLATVKELLEENLPVIISLEFSKNWAHAVLVIGMELNVKGNLDKLYVLDPSSPLPFGSLWNGVIELDKGSSKYPDFYLSHFGSYEKCYLSDWLVFRKMN